MIHAGIHRKWTIKKVIAYTSELEAIIQGENHIDFFKNMRSNKPMNWKKSLEGQERYRFIADACTRMRYCSAKGTLNFQHKGPPGSQPDRLTPWYAHPKRHCKKWRIIFGHWATRGYFRTPNLVCVDSGCIWGKHLTAIQLDCKDERKWQIECD